MALENGRVIQMSAQVKKSEHNMEIERCFLKKKNTKEALIYTTDY